LLDLPKNTKMFKKFLFSLTFIALFNSCVSKKDIYYFQDIDTVGIENSFKFLNIQPGDILDIQIKALNPESILVFQRQTTLGIQQQQIQDRAIEGYLVGEDGSINLPILGDIDTSNQNTQTLAQNIQKALNPYVKDPTVNIRLLNFRVSVLGEVQKPGTFTVLEERLSLPQALGLAGDLTINGDRNNLLLIRSEDGKKINQILDLTKTNLLKSPFYFLKQNDIIYVRPNNARVKSSGLVGDAGTIVSILSLAVSILILLN
jgi:polysaccharide export outer membrane protein